MTNPLYHIQSQAPVPTGSTSISLFVQIDTNGLFLMQLDGAELTELKYFRLESPNTEEYLTELESIFNEQFAGPSHYKKTVVIFNWPDNSLVPDKFYSPEGNRKIIELMHGDLQKGTILSEEVAGYGLHNVYRLPAELHESVISRLPAAAIWHFSTLWLECGKAQTGENHPFVQILIYPGYFLVRAEAGNELLLLQRFVYESDDDVHFYLLSIFENLGLEKGKTDLFLSGFVFEDSALMDTLRKIFPRFALSGATKSSVATWQTDSFPDHFFSPLLNIGKCVS